MRSRPRRTSPLTSSARAGGLVLLLAAAVACGSPAAPSPTAPAPTASSPAAPSEAPTSTPTDAAYVLHMLPHHRRALEVGALLAAQGSDPRAREFGGRIVDEQTPEEQRLTGWVTQLGLTPSAADAGMADGYVDDAALARLRSETGVAFDRDALLLSARSESGAAAMSAAELAQGTFAPARELATAISTAPAGEIPELQRLAAALG